MNKENGQFNYPLSNNSSIPEFNFALNMLEFNNFEAASDHLLSLVRDFPIPIWAYNTKGEIVFWNKAAENTFGLLYSKVIGARDPFLLFKEIADNPIQAKEKSFTSKNGKKITLYLQFIRKAKAEIISHVWVCGYDISRFKQFEESSTAKIENLSNLLSIINHSDSFLYMRENDLDWTIKFTSPNFNHYFEDADAANNKQLTFAKYIDCEDIVRIKAELLIAERNQINEMRLEYRMITKNNKSIWVLDATELIRNDKGQVIGFQGVITNINYRKKVEDKIKVQHKIIRKQNTELSVANESLKKSYLELSLANEKLTKNEIALRESEELYRQLVQTSPDVISMIDLSGNLIYSSPNSQKLFGYDENEPVEGKNIFQFIHPADLDLAKTEMRKVIEGQITSAGIYKMVKQDKTSFFAEVNSTLIKDFQGNIKGMISIIRDVTERKEVEIELIKAKNKAEESDRLKSSFLSNMSHEIRTPMNGILGFANLLNDDSNTPEQRAEFIEIINQNGNNLIKLIEDILDIAKLESGHFKLRESPVYINQILYDQYVLYSNLLGEKTSNAVKLALNLPAYHLEHEVLMDADRVKQILSNLLSNAVKFTEKGTIEFGYTLESPNILKFYVKDSGIGIPSEKHEIIFDRFRQADESNSRKYGGTGLGLTISANLVKLMGGKIWLESEIGKETIFHFQIPYKTEKLSTPLPVTKHFGEKALKEIDNTELI